MKLIIISILQTIEHEIAWVEANTPLGNFVIQPNHAPLMLLLSAQKECLYCLSTGKQESFIPERGGILRITPQEITAIMY